MTRRVGETGEGPGIYGRRQPRLNLYQLPLRLLCPQLFTGALPAAFLVVAGGVCAAGGEDETGAVRARLGQGLLVGQEIAGGVIGAPIERPA